MKIAGLDVAFTNDFMALVILEYDYKKIRILHLCTWRKIDWQFWRNDMRSKLSKFGIDKIFVDSTNNQSVVSELQNLGFFVEGVIFSNTSKRDMVQNATKLIMTGVLTLPVASKINSILQKKLFQELLLELEEQEYRQDSANPKLSHPPGRHDDLLWALCLALYGTKIEDRGEPFIGSLSLYDDPYSLNTNPYEINSGFQSKVLDRFRNPGIDITDVKINYPGND